MVYEPINIFSTVHKAIYTAYPQLSLLILPLLLIYHLVRKLATEVRTQFIIYHHAQISPG